MAVRIARATETRAYSMRAVFSAAMTAGLVFLGAEMLLVALFTPDSAWTPVRMIGAIVLGREALPPPATFHLGIVTTALVTHLALSFVFTLILSLIVHRLDRATAMLAGGVFGLVLYFVNFYGFTAIFPWFAQARNWVSVVSHLAFGLVAAYTYVRLEKPEGDATA